MEKFAKNTLALITFFSIRLLVFAQESSTELPKIIPPSPEASAFFRFLDYPVNYSTGIPQVSIPLYKVRSGKLTVPISISYHASGRKVNDYSGPIGLGWSLNAGGLISRTVYGAAEFGTASDGSYPFPSPLKLEENLNGQDKESVFAYLVGIEHDETGKNYGYGVNKWVDTEYDIFSYSFNDNNGRFIFKDNNGIKTPVFIPLKPYKLEWEANEELSSIAIIDDKGNKYYFSKGARFSQNGYQVISNWLLKKIISSDLADTISFKYELFYQERISFNQERVVYDSWGKANPPWSDDIQDRENKSIQFYQGARLLEIAFKHGKVSFNTDAENRMVKEIFIKNHNNEIIKSIQFSQSILNTFFFGKEAVHRLDQIFFKDKQSTIKNKYSFDYYPNELLGDNAMNIKYHDWWGYYNARERTTVVPGYRDIPYSGTGGGVSFIDFGGPMDILEPRLEGMQSGVLRKIKYPTGGSSEFIYSLNQYKDVFSGEIRDCGGLRINQIITKDNNGNTYYKTYKYGKNEEGYGFISIAPSLRTTSYESQYVRYIYTETLYPEVNGTYRERVFKSSFLPSLGHLVEKPIVYPEVTEYHGTLDDNLGKTIYKYDFNIQTPSGLGYVISMPRYHVYEYNYWKENSLIEKSEYKSLKNPEGLLYRIQQKVNYDYETNKTEDVKGLHLQRTHVLLQENNQPRPLLYLSKHAAVTENRRVYGYRNYTVSVGTKKLKNIVDSTFTDNNSDFVNITEFTYNAKELISETQKSTSDKEMIKEVIKYPFDFPSDFTLKEMVDRNMINYVIERSKFKNSTPLKFIKNIYKNWGGSVFAPEKIYTKQGEADSYDVRLRYHAYDNNSHPLTVSKESGVPISYIYGYKNDFPVAEVKNATQSQIFYTSFEGNDGNSNDSKTGLKSRMNGFQKTLSDLTNGDYNLTFWRKSDELWELKEIKDIQVTNGTYKINLSGQLDEIRFYPVGAIMTTYSYNPFEGITSATDENNQTTYYKYDFFNRLQSIRDNDSNIIKQYDYHYKE